MSLFKKFFPRLKKNGSDNYEIAVGIFWVALFSFSGKIFGAAKEIAIAYRYGVSPEVDAYIFIFNLASWPASIWFSILMVVLVPLAVSIRNRSSIKLKLFRAELLGFSLVFALVLLMLTWPILEITVASSWVGLPNPSLEIAKKMIPSMSLIAPLGILVGLMSAWVISAGRQINTLLDGVPAFVLLIAVLISPFADVQVLIWGTVWGYVFNVAFLVIFLKKKREIEGPIFSRVSRYWVRFWSGLGIMAVGQILMSLVTIIDQFYLAHLNEGSISTLNYANRILGLILSMGAIAITRSTLPIFSKAEFDKKIDYLCSITFYWTKIFFILGSVCCLVIWPISEDLVSFIFERGAFTVKNTQEVKEIFNYLLIQIPFYFSGIVLVSFLASRKKYLIITLSGIFNLLIKLLGNYFLIPTMGINGVALSTVLMYIFALIFLLSYVKYEFLRKNTSS